MSQMFHVLLEKETLVFSAAHFITFNGDVCERLHGHNYGVRCEVWGPLDENQYVVDFIALRDCLSRLAAKLDHHMLLPDRHPLIQVQRDGGEVVVRFREKRWVFPAEDCVILPIANTTAELLAAHLGRQLRQELPGVETLDRIALGVDENNGQWGCWTWRRDAEDDDRHR